MPGPAKRSNAHKKGVGSKKIHTGEDLRPPLLTSIPEPPDSLNEHGMEEWNRVCGLLVDEEILTQWDLAAIEIMCLEYERYMEALTHIREKGEYFTTSTGYEQIRPSSKVRNQAFYNYCKLLRLFGGDTEARAKIKRVKPEEKKPSRFSKI